MAMQGCQLVVTRTNFQDMLRTPTSGRAWMVGGKHGHGMALKCLLIQDVSRVLLCT